MNTARSKPPVLARAALIVVIFLTACGDEIDLPGGRDEIIADPGFFAGQRFDCNPDTATPSCPPATCEVDDQGQVDCPLSCGVDQFTHCTVFQGPEGKDLCVPRECIVSAEDTAPVCSETCADDGDVTCYVFDFSCSENQ